MATVTRYLARVNGKTKQQKGLVNSTGSADSGKLVATDTNGRLSESVMPIGIGATTITAIAGEDISAGKFINLFNDAGTLKCRLADNSNNRPANGFTTISYVADEQVTIYPLDGINSNLSGLTVGSDYWLGTAGGVIATPLDSSDDLNINKIDQYLGFATSETELKTMDDSYVVP